MKILVSGTTGFIGKNLIKKLLEKNYTLYAVVRPSSNLTLLEKKVTPYVFDGDVTKLTTFIQDEKIDGVIHLASCFLAQHKSEDIENLIETNVLFSTQLLEASAKAAVSWFINTGTFWQHYENKAYSPVNLYAATKQAFEAIAQYYNETTPIDFVTIKLSDTFGPSDTRPKIFSLWTRLSQTHERLDMSAGKQIIDISPVENIISGYLRVIELLSQDTEKKMKGTSFAIHSDKRVSLKKLAGMFEQIGNVKLDIQWGKKEYRPREVMIPWKGGKKIPDWKAPLSLSDGIKKYFHEQ